jgi:acyl-coenzyme A thioesterase PaaI-like protein
MARADELQHASPEEFWERFEAVMGGPDGLMTYRYLGTRADPEKGGREATLRIRRDMRNPAGGLMAAPLSIALADAAGIQGDALGVPAPIMSSVHMLDAGTDVGEVLVRSEESGHRGRALSFGATSTVVDAAHPERVLAIAEGMSVQVADAPAGYRYVEPGPGVPDTLDLPPLHEAFGARRSALGWELPELSQRIGSTSGSLHHGATQVLLEAAAAELVATQTGTDRLQIEDWTVMYTARGKVGPFLAAGALDDGPLGRHAARMRLTDRGNGDRLIATALAVFRPVD